MNELITISATVIGSQQVKTVNARSLHSFLESKQEFSHWVRNRISRYGFIQDTDFTTIDNFITSPPSIEYHLTIDMAKELSMVERNQKGKQARQYFIECERVAKSQSFQLPTTFSEALYLAAKQAEEIESLKIEAKENQPKVAFAEGVEASRNAIRVGEYVKAISRDHSVSIGRNNFFAWLKHEKILMKNNQPYQRYIDSGWFEVKESTYENENTNGPMICFTTLVTGRGQISLWDRFKKSESASYFIHRKAA